MGPDMHRPRPVWLTDQELRALRVIEDAFATDDPELARLLGGGGPCVQRTMTGSLVRAMTAMLLVIGLLLADVVVQTDGAMLLLLIPPAIWWFGTAMARKR